MSFKSVYWYSPLKWFMKVFVIMLFSYIFERKCETITIHLNIKTIKLGIHQLTNYVGLTFRLSFTAD